MKSDTKKLQLLYQVYWANNIGDTEPILNKIKVSFLNEGDST